MEPREWQRWFRIRGQRELRDLVMSELDPIGVADEPEAADEYDGYLGRIAERLRGRSSAEDIAALLGSFRTDDMGLKPDFEADRRVASHLITWYADAVRESVDDTRPGHGA
jgi:hypothetical protein